MFETQRLFREAIFFKLTSFFVIFCLSGFSSCQKKKNSEEEEYKGNITISGAFALYPLIVEWAEEFEKLHPEVKVNIMAGGTGKGITDVLTGSADLGMVSRDLNPIEQEKGARKIAVAKDAVVPVISTENPLLNALRRKGATRDELKKIWITGEINDWRQLSETDDISYPIQVFTRSDASGAPETWAGFLGYRQENLIGTGVFGDPGVAEAIKKDPHGIGYNNIIYAYDPATRKPYAQLYILPIDFNADGKITSDEDFYDSYDSLTKAIRTGVFPSPPGRELYLVSKGSPQRFIVKAFLRWIFQEGQKFIEPTGYVPLSKDRMQEELAKLN